MCCSFSGCWSKRSVMVSSDFQLWRCLLIIFKHCLHIVQFYIMYQFCIYFVYLQMDSHSLLCRLWMFIGVNQGILSLFCDMTSHLEDDLMTLRVCRCSWLIVCLLLLTYLRMSTRCLAVNQALRLSKVCNQCDSTDVTSYWMSQLSRELLLFCKWFINIAAFGNKC